MSLRLRPHHLLCALTYVGKGYSPEFCANMAEVIVRMAAGEGMTIVEGPDDICAPRLIDPASCHCFEARIADRDDLAVRDLSRILERDIREGGKLFLSGHEWRRMRGHFASGAIRSACALCDWDGLCSEIAAKGFAGTLLSGQQS